MEAGEFQKRFLAWAFNSDQPITSAVVAYNLGITVEEAQDHLISMEVSEAIHQAVDDEGNTYWVMPHRSRQGARRDAAASPMFVASDEKGAFNPADLPPAPIYSNPADQPEKRQQMIVGAVSGGGTDAEREQRAVQALAAASKPTPPQQTREQPLEPVAAPGTVTLKTGHIVAGGVALVVVLGGVAAVLVFLLR